MTLTNVELKSLYGQMGRFAGTMLAESGISKTQLKAIFQAVDDKWEAGRVSLKADMDAAAGVTLANNIAKKFGKAWLNWKVEGE